MKIDVLYLVGALGLQGFIACCVFYTVHKPKWALWELFLKPFVIVPILAIGAPFVLIVACYDWLIAREKEKQKRGMIENLK